MKRTAKESAASGVEATLASGASVNKQTLSQGLRRYLYLTAAITGAAIMVVEILGAKMLSPYVGMSHFVWTAQIAVTLVALTCGYYFGGRMADRSQNLNRLYCAILGAAVYLVLTVWICPKLAMACLDLDLAIGSLCASALLFFVPLALLAMTGPFLVRVITSNVAGVGGNVGRLTAIGTLGSFIGTLCIGYIMLPLLPNSVSMDITAGALTLVCAGYFLIFNRAAGAASKVAVIVVLALEVSSGRGPRPNYTTAIERFACNSNYGELRVLDHPSGKIRLLSNDFLIQDSYDPTTRQSRFAFTVLLERLARGYTTNIHDVLCIGLGAGFVPMDFARGGAAVDVVEINPAMVPIAEKFFGLDRNKVHVVVDDGRHFLNRCRKQYDVVVLDAFLGDASPAHLMTREAFAEMRRVLRPGGSLVINAFCQVTPGRDYFAASLNKTLKTVFTTVRVHPDGDQSYLVASDFPHPKLTGLPNLEKVYAPIRSEVEAAFTSLVEPAPERGQILTDDFNPAGFYDAKNREMLRRRFALQSLEW